MGEKDSSQTRVQPVFNELLNRWPAGDDWVGRLCEMAAATRQKAKPPSDVGPFVPGEVPGDPAARMGNVFERVVPPPTAFLRWLLENPDELQVPNEQTFGTTTDDAREWRRKLFRGTAQERDEVQCEGLGFLEKRQGRGSYRKRWAFEGWSHVDCCLIAENLVLFIEGKRTEAVSPSTRWFKQRSQLWRNVEAAEEFAAGKQFAVILAVETEAVGTDALASADALLDHSYPHLTPKRRAELARHLLGFVTWPQVVRKFELPKECLLETVPARKHSPTRR
jgi:hypothetical protein